MTEDLKTLTQENRCVNNEFEKSARANELLRQQNHQLTDRERQA